MYGGPDRTLHAKTGNQPAVRLERYMKIDTVSRRYGYTHSRRQILQWRWPCNPNGRSNFRNLGLFTFTRSQLTLRRLLRGWWRLPVIAQTERCRRQKHRRRLLGSIEIPQIRKFMQSVSKNFFLLIRTTPPAIDHITHRLLSCYHS